jgi:hypothetical protein
MPDSSAIVIAPTNNTIVYTGKTPGMTVEYANLNGLTYATLAADTYGQIQNLGSTNSDTVVIPTNSITLYLSITQTLATYASIQTFWVTYSGMSGLSYGQLGVVP